MKIGKWKDRIKTGLIIAGYFGLLILGMFVIFAITNFIFPLK